MSFPSRDHLLSPEDRAAAFLKKNEDAGVPIAEAERAELMALVAKFYREVEQIEAAGVIERHEAADA